MTQKIGILGSDNSHAERFPEILNVEGHPDYWPDSGARVWSIWGEEPERTAQVAEKVKIPVIASTPQEVVAESDMVFVITRDGGMHLDLARLVIDAGKPLFVDKPMTTKPRQASELLSLVKESGVPMVSFTTLRYGTESVLFEEELGKIAPVRYAFYTGPASRRHPHGGLPFYAIHTVELMLQYHGVDLVSVHAVEIPPGADKSNITATCRYADDTLVTLALIGDGVYHFYKLAVGRNGVADVSRLGRSYATDQASLSTALTARAGDKSRVASPRPEARNAGEAIPADHYPMGVREMLAVLRGEKQSRISHEEMLRAIQVCAAIEESLQKQTAVDPRALV